MFLVSFLFPKDQIEISALVGWKRGQPSHTFSGEEQVFQYFLSKIVDWKIQSELQSYSNINTTIKV